MATTAPSNTPTVEELKKQTEDLHKSMKWTAPAEDKPVADPVVVAPPSIVVAPALPAPPPVVVPPPAPIAATAPVAPAQPDTRAIAAQAAKIVMAELPPNVAASPAAAQPVTPEKIDDLTKEDKKDYETALFLERENPSAKSGLAKRLLEYFRANYAYQDEWLSKNAGEDFDPEAQEHEAWYAAHPCPVTADELEAGRERMLEEKIYLARVKPELDKIKSQRALDEARHTISANIDKWILKFITAVSPEIAAIVADSNGNPNFSAENIKKADDADPIAYAVLMREISGRIEPLISTLELSVYGGDQHRIDPKKGGPHVVICRAAAELEAFYSKPENRLRDGKVFITNADITKLLATKSEQEIDAQYWSLQTDDVAQKLIETQAEYAKKNIEASESLAKRKYQPAQPVSQPAPTIQSSAPPAPAIAAPPIPASTSSAKPTPPAPVSGGDVVQTAHLPKPGEKSFSEQMAETHFRK